MSDRDHELNKEMGINRADGQYSSGDDDGDLSAWEYLTATYDDKQMFSNDCNSIQVPGRSTDQQNDDRLEVTKRATYAATSNQTISEAASYKGVSETIQTNQRMTTHSASDPHLSRDNQQFNPFFYANTPQKQWASSTSSSAAQLQQNASPQMHVKSWSYPMLQNMNALSSTGQQVSIPSSYNKNPFMIPGIPMNQTISGSERSHVTTELPVHSVQYHNLYNNPFPNALSTTNQISFTALNTNARSDTNTDDYILPKSQSPLKATARGQSVTKIASPAELFATNSVTDPYIDKRADSVYTSTKHRMPSTKKVKLTSKRGDVGIAMDPYQASTSFNTETLLPSNPRSASATNTIIPSVSATTMNSCFSQVEAQQIQNWITLQDPSMIPPYQQMRIKKLLLQPLTPYNYYFRDERDNIVNQISNVDDPLPPPISDFSVSKLQHLLYQRWFIDPVKKRRAHRKVHGKIDFQRLSKEIAERWQQAPKCVREFYRAVSRYDDTFYQHHLEIIKASPDIRR